MGFAMPSSPPGPGNLSTAGLFTPSSGGETPSSPEHSREKSSETCPWSCWESRQNCCCGQSAWALLMPWKKNLFIPTSARMCFLSPLSGACSSKGWGPCSCPCSNQRNGNISFPNWAQIQWDQLPWGCFCWNHWCLPWKSVRINFIAESFWPEQELNFFVTTNGVKEEHLWNASMESWESLVGPRTVTLQCLQAWPPHPEVPGLCQRWGSFSGRLGHLGLSARRGKKADFQSRCHQDRVCHEPSLFGWWGKSLTKALFFFFSSSHRGNCVFSVEPLNLCWSFFFRKCRYWISCCLWGCSAENGLAQSLSSHIPAGQEQFTGSDSVGTLGHGKGGWMHIGWDPLHSFKS